MASENENSEGGRNISVKVPIGGFAALVVLGLAVAGYLIATREETEETGDKPKAGNKRNYRRRIGLMTLITLIENDVTRKAVVAMLRAMARRA